MSSIFARVRVVLAFVLLTVGFAPAASAVTSTFKILLDLDNHQNTGCDVPTLTGSFQGAERILTVTVDTIGTSAAQVTALQYQSCLANPNFGAPVAVPAPVGHPLPWPVGVSNGTGGTSVIESYIPFSLAPIGPSPIVRMGVLAVDSNGTLRDELVKARPGNGNGPPILLQVLGITEIPTLSDWGLILLGLVLAVAAVALLRRRTAAAFLIALVLLGLAGVAWAAATTDLNGNTLAEWTDPALAVDANPDTPPAPAGADIRAFFAFRDTTLNALAFRIDALLLFNTPPTANDDTATVIEDSGANAINVLANDTDPDVGDTFTVASVTQPANGTVAITGGGTGLTYTPNANYCNQPPGTTLDTFTYTLAPGGDTATVTVTVTCVDDDPTAVADAATVLEDAAATAVPVLANDTDPDGGPISISAVTQPANGTVVITGGGTGLTYAPNANYCNSVSGTPDTFTYTLTPGGSTATVSMTVTCVDDPPTAVADAATVTEDSGANAIDVLANDTDIDAGPKSVASVTQPANGTVVITGGGTGLTYAPNANYCNQPPGTTLDTFSYTLAPGGSSTTVTVTVTCVDDAPVAVNDSATVNEDSGANAIDVLANDTDVDAGPKSVASVTQPANGAVVITGGGTGLTYAPNANYCNTPPGTSPDTFTYTLTPGSSTATVSVSVTCVDDNPVAVADTATVAEDSGANPIDVLANDTDVDAGPKSVASVTQPANGSVAITGGGTGVSYTPNANYCNQPPGTTLDTFTYTLAPGGSSTTVTVTVTCVDDNPVAVADAATVVEDSGANPINVLANDPDLDGGPKTVAAVTQPANGAVVITGGGTGVSYTPNANYCNTPPGTTLDTFSYSLAPGGSTTTVTVSVTCVDDSPVVDLNGNAVAGSDFVVTFTEGNGPTLLEDPLNATVTDVDSANLASLTVTLTNLLDTGFETLSADVTVTTPPNAITANYVPATGVLTLTGPTTVANFQAVLRTVKYQNTDVDPDTTPRVIHFVANDGNSDSNTATSTVTIVATDTPPTAVNDSATVNEDSGANAIDVLANDTDPDNGPKSVASVTQPANGTVVITGGGTGVSYTPNANYCNSVSGTPDTFTYTLSPGGSSATVSVTVTCVDDNPVAVADAATVVEDSGANAIDVLANDTDADGGPKSVASVTQPANGTVVITGGGTGVSYTPNANYCNSVSGTPDTFTYTLTPGGSSTTVTVTVTCVDDNPTAVADAATVVEDSGANPIDVLANDTDPDGGPKSVASVTQPANGTVVITGGGTGVSYTPNANYCNSVSGPADTFTYTLSPGGSSTTVSVTVTCVDDNPVAVADAATVNEDSVANPINVLANDTDIDGGPKSVASVTQPANGTVAITGGGTGVSYTPNANYCNQPPGTTLDTFTYTLSPGGSSTTVTVTVTCVDDNPVAVADAATVVEDSGANAIDVLANDTDVDGGPKSVASVTQPANGTVVITGGGTGLTYAPNANYCNQPPGTTLDTFTYTLSPGGSSTTVTVTVTCVDDNPVAVADSATVVEDSSANAINVLANDTDVDGGPKSVASVTQPANGAVVITGGGTGVSYTPNANYCNTPPGTTPDTFTYTLTPGGSSTTVTVSVTCVNDPPTDIALSNASVNENQPVGTAVGNFSTTDPDPGDTFTYTLVAGAGSTDNASFQIVGNQLRTAAVFNFEVKSSYSIRVRSTDSGALFVEKQFTITIIDLPEPPNANDDTFDTIGNTELRVDLAAGTTPNIAVTSPASPPNRGVLHNDIDEDTGQTNTLTVSGIVGCADTTAPFGDGPVCNTANGGTVTLQSDGRFSYIPKNGDTAASDSFTYTARDSTALTDTGVVTINRFGRVWYVKNDSPAGGLGRSTDPFDTLAEAQTASSANDYIFVYFGDGTTTGQAAGIALKNGQHLIGEFAGLAITFSPAITFNGAAGTTSVQLLPQPAPTACSGNPCRPMLDNPVAGGNAVSATDVIPVEIVALNLAGNANGIDITHAAAFAGSGSTEIRDNVVRSAGAEGIDINKGGTGSLTLSLHDNTVTAAGNGIDVNRTAGTMVINGFANNAVSGNTGGSGIVITGPATFDSDTVAAGNQTVSGGTTVIGASGNGVGGAGLVMTSVTGTLVFTDLDIFADGGAGLRASGAGGFTLQVGAGVGIIEAVGGPAVDVTSADIDLQLPSLKSTNSASTGVSLDTVTGTFSAGSGSSITNATGTDFNINAGSAAVTYNGTITDDVGQLVAITNTTGGTKSFTGAITDGDDGDGSGVSLSNNGGATISFSGGLVLSTGANPAFAATGGGTVAVCDENPCNPGATGALVNKITTTTGTALNVANTTISPNKLEFRSISAGTGASGPTNGIVLNNTGASGGLTVSGTGANGTGGLIQRATGDGISLTDTRNVSLSWMDIDNNGNNGINGLRVNSLTLTSCRLRGNTNALTEAGLKLIDLAGTSSVSNTEVSGSTEDNVHVLNNSPGGSITFTNCTVRNNSAASGNIGINVATANTGTLSATITGGTLNGNRTVSIRGDAADTSSLTVNINGPVITAGTAGNPQGNQGVEISSSATSTVVADVRSVQISGLINTGINVFAGNSSNVTATVFGNTVTNTFVSAGASNGFGIRVFQSLNSTLSARVEQNNVSEVSTDYGILAEASGDTDGAANGRGALKIAMVSNTSNIRPGALDAIRIQARNTNLACAKYSSNSVTTAGSGFGLAARQADTATFNLEGLALGAQNGATTETYLEGQNPATSPALIYTLVTTSFTGVPANSCGYP